MITQLEIATVVSAHKAGHAYLCLWENHGPITYLDRPAFRAALREECHRDEHHVCFALRRPLASAHHDPRLLGPVPAESAGEAAARDLLRPEVK